MVLTGLEFIKELLKEHILKKLEGGYVPDTVCLAE
jgi:hypothetical protein